MPFSFSYSDEFRKQYRKLDKGQRELIKKRIRKIAENPELGKPLHAPLQNYLSERVEKTRIVYRICQGEIQFAWVQHRGKAYRKK